MPYSTRLRCPQCTSSGSGSAGLDQNFYDVTIVDMGDVPESSVSIPELWVTSVSGWHFFGCSHPGDSRQLPSVGKPFESEAELEC